MGYGYDSEEGRDAVSAMIGALRNAAAATSQALAVERGPFPLYDVSDLTTPRRNVAILTVDPTGTTSMLMGVSSGVEPVFAPFIYRKIGTEYHALIHPLFQELLEEHAAHPNYSKGGGWDWDKVVAAVQANHGSVRGLHFIPEEVSSVMACAHDIAPADHVRMHGVVQRAFDGGDRVANSISKTINLANEATVADVSTLRLAFAPLQGHHGYRDGSRDFQFLPPPAPQQDSASEGSRLRRTPRRVSTCPSQHASSTLRRRRNAQPLAAIAVQPPLRRHAATSATLQAA